LYPTTSSEVEGVHDNSTPLVNAVAVREDGAEGTGLLTLIAAVHTLDTPEELIARTLIDKEERGMVKMDLFSSYVKT
jgi:hypothetical protein